jgi:type IV pilus assembly protein PilN
MIKINLVAEARAGAPRATQARFQIAGKTNNLLFYAAVAIGILYVLGMWWHLASVKHDLDDKIHKAQQEVDRLKSIIDEVNGYERKKADLEAKINLINELKRNQKGPVRLMDEVSKALPDLVWLTDMSLTGNTIAISGMAMTPNAVANFIENLKKSPYFAEPTFDSLNQASGIYSFRLSVTFKYMLPPATGSAAPATATSTPPAASEPAA